MRKFKVLKDFTWGELILGMGDYIFVEDLPADNSGYEQSIVTKEYFPDRKQTISSRAVAGMMKMQRIEVCD